MKTRAATLDVQLGAFDLQRVALEEGIRITLEEYEKYGVPEGETEVSTATRTLRQCSAETITQHIDCVLEEELAPLWRLATQSLLCGLVSGARQLGCGLDVVQRYTNGTPD